MNLFRGILIAWIALHLLSPAGVAADGETPFRYEPPRRLNGTLYEMGSNQKHVLFKFARTATRTGSTVNVLREFRYPDDRVAARERVVYDGDNLVSYELDELQIDARGIVKVRRDPKDATKGTISFEYFSDTRSGAKPKVNTETLRPDTLVGDMIAPFLEAHWDDLVKGDVVRCRYVAAARAETVGFKFVKQSESTWQGKPVVVVRMVPSSFVIAMLVDPIFFTMEKDAPHHVLQYDGRTTPRIRVGNEWKDLDATTMFDWN